MGQIVGSAAKPKRCNIQSLSQFGTPAAGEHILVSSDNSMNAAGQGNFDCYIVGDGTTAATALELHTIADDSAVKDGKNAVSSGALYGESHFTIEMQSDFVFGFVSNYSGTLIATTSAGWGIHVIAAEADADTNVEIEFTRRDNHTYAGRAFIVDSPDQLVADYTAGPFVHTFVLGVTETWTYTIPAGKYLCIFGRIKTSNASINDSIAVRTYTSVKDEVRRIEQEVKDVVMIDGNEVGAVKKKTSIMTDGAKFINVSAGYWVSYFVAPCDCTVEMTATRVTSYVYSGKVCIVDSEESIVVGNEAVTKYSIAKDETYVGTYELLKGQCLCVNQMQGDTLGVVMKKYTMGHSIEDMSEEVEDASDRAKGLTEIDQDYEGLDVSQGYAVSAVNGSLIASSGNYAFDNIPVVPSSKIVITIKSVSSTGGRGFALYDRRHKFISGVAAVIGTYDYAVDIPSNAYYLAVTTWGDGGFVVKQAASVAQVFDISYKRVYPYITGDIVRTLNLESIEGNCLDELYLTEESKGGTASVWSWFMYNGLPTIGGWNKDGDVRFLARGATAKVGGYVIPISIYATYDADNFQVGTIVGYCTLKDIVPGGQSVQKNNIVYVDYVRDLRNSPIIAAYIASKSNTFSATSVQISLPDNITAVVGDTLQLFYRGFIFSPLPEKYDVLCACNVGKQFPRYFEYTPTTDNIGSTTFTIRVKDDNRNIIAEKTCTLTTVGKASSPSSMKNILCFGASTTQNGEWPSEAYRRLTGSGGTPIADGLTNVSFRGSMQKNGAGYFGKGGWNWTNFTTNNSKAYRFYVSGVAGLSLGAQYTNNGNTFTIIEINVTSGEGNILCSVSSLTPAPSSSGTLTKSSGTGDSTITYSSVVEDNSNPLWDSANNKMSFIPYANSYCDGQIDIVYVWLGYNGLTNGQTDFTSIMARVKVFADTLHSEFPNAKLKIMGEGIPSFRGGMGANYGASGSGFADGYGILLSSLNLSDAYQEFANQSDYSDFVEFVNVATQFDVEYNMQHTQKAVNTRNTEVTEWMDTNGVHPATTGYMQVADVVYRNMIKELQ